MKANELMIGDLILCKSDDKIVKVDSIITQSDGSCLISTQNGLSFDYMFDPVPITPEILEKNFEKKTFYGIFDDYFDFEIREFNDSMYIVNYHCCEMDIPDTQISGICWVHELQHAFRLCGIDKILTIDNNFIRNDEKENKY